MLLFTYVRTIRREKLEQFAAAAVEKAKQSAPVVMKS